MLELIRDPSCSILGCVKKHFGLGFCQAHYYRFKKYGDPLAGRTPNGELKRFLEEVAIPYVGADCLIWPYSKKGAGYGDIQINGERFSAHRLVCESAKGPAPTSEHHAAHSCGNRACVNPSHLRWATPKENSADKIAHNTVNSGARNGRAKLTESQATEIYRLRGVKSTREIAENFGVTGATVTNIHSGRTWASHVGAGKNA